MAYDAYLYGMILRTNSFLLKGDYPKADTYGEILEKYSLPGGETGTCATVLLSLGRSVKMDGTYMGRTTMPFIQNFYKDKACDLTSLHLDESFDGLEDNVLVAGNTRTPLGQFQAFYADPNHRWNPPKEEDIRQAQSLPASSELYLRPMDKLIQTAGSSALPVLIQGAVGTHKGVVARRIHTKSATEGTTLMRLQCRDLTEKNWDMLLNNAASPIHATGYTVYLENVDTLPKDLQQQVGTYIEDTKMTHRHRVISSSCCDLSAEVARGQFSSRLYLQLSGFTINVPSLAQRKEDIPAFVNMMIPQYNTALAKSTVGMEPDAMELMVEFEWPLNLVQLEKVLRQMIAASSGFYITAAEVAAVLQNEMRKVSALPPAVDLSGTLEDIERRVIEQVLREENMNQSAAAKRLGIGRSTLWRKIAGSGGK